MTRFVQRPFLFAIGLFVAAVAVSLASCQSSNPQGQAAATAKPSGSAAARTPAAAPPTVAATPAARGSTVAMTAKPSSTVGIPAGKRVFYASHSLMWDTPTPVVELAKSAGITSHELVFGAANSPGVQRMGFSYTRQHWERPDAQNEAKRALLTGQVDAFFMSPMELPDEGIDNFVKFGLLQNPNMDFYVQNNWTAFNADGQYQHRNGRGGGPGVSWDQTTVEMLKPLDLSYEKAFEDQVGKLNKEIGRQSRPVLFIIPTSQAVTAIRIMVAQKQFPGLDLQSQLFADNIGHPAPPLIALNAYVHFATIYGRSPVGLPMPSVLKNAAARYPKMDEAANKILQELAWKTVTEYSQYDGVKVPAK